MDWELAKKTDDGAVIPESWIHLHYYDALNSLFRIENSLRVFVYIVLKNQFFEKWADINITSDDSEPATIKSIASRRFNQAQNFGYLGYAINCPVMYLTSGELIRLITNDNYWKYFKPFFPGSKDVIKNKLDEIGVIRNSFAHFRPMKYDDVELIKQNAKHTLSGVEDYLNQLGSCQIVVPTNTQEQWYQSFSTLSTDLCKLKYSQCVGEQWVEMGLICKLQTLRTLKINKDFFDHTILNIISPAVLTNYGNIVKYATCLTETQASANKYDPQVPNFFKRISILFTRKVLGENQAVIKADIESILRTIAEETELILNDNLARGKLVSVASVKAIYKTGQDSSGWWNLNAASTLCPITAGGSPEYWGNTPLYFSFLTSAQKYPWMPVEVSEFGAPF